MVRSQTQRPSAVCIRYSKSCVCPSWLAFKDRARGAFAVFGMDMILPETCLCKPVCRGIAEKPFGLFADKGKLKRLGIGFPDNSVNGVDERLISLLRLLLLLPYRGSSQLPFHGRKKPFQFLSGEKSWNPARTAVRAESRRGFFRQEDDWQVRLRSLQKIERSDGTETRDCIICQDDIPRLAAKSSSHHFLSAEPVR